MSDSPKAATNLLVKIDGKEEIKATATRSWKTTHGAFVTHLVLDQQLDAPDQFEVGFVAMEEGDMTVFDYVKDGSKIELGFSYETPVTAMFTGEVHYIEVEFDESGETAVLRGYDHTHRLTRGHRARHWGDGKSEDQKTSDIVSDVIDQSEAREGGVSNGLSPDQVDETDSKSRYVPQAMTTNYDFLHSKSPYLARRTGSDPQDDKKISFRKLNINDTPVGTVFRDKKMGDNPLQCISARFSVATFPSFAKVRVHGWNPKKKKAFVGEITTCSPDIDCSTANAGWESGTSAVGKALWGDAASGAVYERVESYCETVDEAKEIAQGIFDSLSLKYLTGEATVRGCPEIVPGSVIEFHGFGERVTGKFFVISATHTIAAKGGQAYTTSFKFCANAAKAPKT
jgi:phage protein D